MREAPKEYNTYNVNAINLANEVLDEFGPRMKWNEGDSVLDVGSGSGNVTVESVLPRLHENYKKLVGMDLSSKMVNFANESYGEKFPKVQFVTGDIASDSEELSAHFEKYDHVTSMCCLHHIQNQKEALSNIYKMIKPGGDCLIWFLVKHSSFQMWDLLSRRPKWAEYMKDIDTILHPCYKAKDASSLIRSYLKEIPFSSFEVYEREKILDYESVEIFKGIALAVNPFIERLTPAMREEYTAEYMQQIAEMGLIQDNGKVKNQLKMLIVYAKKE